MDKNNNNIYQPRLSQNYSGTVIMITPNDYQALLNENERLRKEISRLITNEEILHRLIIDK